MTNTGPEIIFGNGSVTTDISGYDRPNTVKIVNDGKIIVIGQTEVVGYQNYISVCSYKSDGSLDSSFGVNGTKQIAAQSCIDAAFQPDGKMLILGASGGDFLVFRLMPDGSRDLSFGDFGGKLIDFGSGDEGREIALQSDGKILITGLTGGENPNNFAIARLNPDGSLDSSFGAAGKIVTSFGGNDFATDIVVQSDNHIIVTGSAKIGDRSYFAIARYAPDGSLDASFDGDGKLLTEFYGAQNGGTSVALQADGKIIVAGYGAGQFALVRYNPDGSLDTSFDYDGKSSTNFKDGAIPEAVILQPDGKIIVVGHSYMAFGIARFNADGSLDTGFGGDGMVETAVGRDSWAFDVALQDDGKILVVGDAWKFNSDFAVLRLNSDGTPDLTFHPLSTPYVEGSALVLESEFHVFDAELESIGSYGGLTVQFSRHGGANGDDHFQASGTLSTLNAGDFLSVDGIRIGRVVVNGGGKLSLEFSSSATRDFVDKALGQIAYANSSDSPPATIDIDCLVSDGNAGGQGSGGPLSVSRTISLIVTAINDPVRFAPEAIGNYSSIGDYATIGRPYALDLPIGLFIDPDTPVLHYQLANAGGGALPPWLRIDPISGRITGTPPAYDAGIWRLSIVADDGDSSASVAFTLEVGTNNPPEIVSGGAGATAVLAHPENDMSVMVVSAVDPDRDAALSYFISGGADAALFRIDSATGALRFVSAPDYEAPADTGADHTYNVTVKVTDGSLSDSQAIAVTVTNVNEVPVITSNGGGATAAVAIAENTAAVTTVTATDPDDGTTLAYTIAGGADAALFQINSTTGVLSFKSAPNFEAPADAGGNNIYDVVVQASDGSLTDSQAIAVTATNVNGEPVVGTPSGDTLNGDPGNNVIDGGLGVDVAVFTTTRGSATVTRNPDHTTTITTSADGTDTLRHVEQVKFADGLFSFTFGGGSAPVVANFNPANGWASQDQNPRHLADVNGDGFMDIVGFGYAGVLVSFGSAGGSYSGARVVVSNFGQTAGWASDNGFHRELADVNGDGRADILGFGYAGTLVSLAKADGTFDNPFTGASDFGVNQGWANQNGFARTVGDVNGDGKADIVGFGYAGTLVALGNGNGTFQTVKTGLANFGVNQGWTSDNTYHRALADVNGDGKADLVGFGQAGTYVALSNGDGTFANAQLVLSNFGVNQGWASNDSFARLVTDVNGDQVADIVGFGIAGTLVAFGNGDGTFTDAGFDVADFGKNQGWSSDNTYHREIADMNHDGLADVVGFGIAGVLVGQNQGDFVI